MTPQQRKQYNAGRRYADKQISKGRRSPDDKPINDGVFWEAGYYSAAGWNHRIKG